MSSGAGHITAAAQPTVYVLAVGSVSTRAALMAAIPLSKGMRARLVVLVPQVVPYPLPVDQPPEATEFIHRRFRSLVQELDGDAEIVVHLCRTPNDVVQAIPLDSTVVVGGRSRYMWPTKEERLSRHLIRLGHHVVFAASGGFPRGPSVAAVVVGALMITVPRIVPARAAGQTSADDADLQVSDRTRRAAQSRVASDFSDRPFFITDTVGRLRSDQQTLTAGMIW